jgi:glycosyltransferase involved in cell wall biosynthesis
LDEHLVDVVIPVFNAAGTVRAAIESIQAQTISSLRIIVVDDGSTDDTPRLLAEMANGDPRLQVISQPNSGIAAARNAGLARCRAEFVACQDADDLAYPRRLEQEVIYLRKHQECVGISGAFRHIDEHGRVMGKAAPIKHPSPDEADPEWSPAREPYLQHSFLLARLSVLRTIGGYREFVYGEDADLYWRMQELGRLHNLDEVLGEYRMHNASVSSSSVSNGRVGAVYSQLAAISAVRRRSGRTDLTFSKETAARYRALTSLAEIFKLGCYDLAPSEKEHLEIALAAKLLELADYRPFELELADCQFIRRALAKSTAILNARNRAELRRLASRAAARLLSKGLLKEAVAVAAPSEYPTVAARLLKRIYGRIADHFGTPWQKDHSNPGTMGSRPETRAR